MLPAEGAAGRHLARASRLAGAARIDLSIGAGVAIIGFGEMGSALVFVAPHDLEDWLLRVVGPAFLGLLASVWGWALSDQSLYRLVTARGAERAIKSGQPGWAFALAGLDADPNDHRA